MKKNLLGINTEPKAVGGEFTVMDGFRFGFGMFLAWLLGLSVLALIAYAIAKAFKLIA